MCAHPYARPSQRDIARFQARSHADKLAARHAVRARTIAGRWMGSFSGRQWLDLLADWDYTCAYCHRQFPPHELTPDHVLPLSRGGKNCIANLAPACKRCNSAKNGRTADEYRAYLAAKQAQAAA